MTTEYLYRAEIRRYSIVIDPDADLYGISDPELEIRRFVIIKRTRCGAWIGPPSGTRFVNLKAKKRWAHPSKAEALEGLVRRCEVNLSYCRKRLAKAKAFLALAIKEKHNNDTREHVVEEPRPSLQ